MPFVLCLLRLSGARYGYQGYGTPRRIAEISETCVLPSASSLPSEEVGVPFDGGDQAGLRHLSEESDTTCMRSIPSASASPGIADILLAAVERLREHLAETNRVSRQDVEAGASQPDVNLLEEIYTVVGQ